MGQGPVGFRSTIAAPAASSFRLAKAKSSGIFSGPIRRRDQEVGRQVIYGRLPGDSLCRSRQASGSTPARTRSIRHWSTSTARAGASTLRHDLNRHPVIRAIFDDHDDAALQRLMTNLAGHDMDSVLTAFHAVEDDRPTCFIAYTIKGYGLPLPGTRTTTRG